MLEMKMTLKEEKSCLLEAKLMMPTVKGIEAIDLAIDAIEKIETVKEYCKNAIIKLNGEKNLCMVYHDDYTDIMSRICVYEETLAILEGDNE